MGIIICLPEKKDEIEFTAMSPLPFLYFVIKRGRQKTQWSRIEKDAFSNWRNSSKLAKMPNLLEYFSNFCRKRPFLVQEAEVRNFLVSCKLSAISVKLIITYFCTVLKWNYFCRQFCQILMKIIVPTLKVHWQSRPIFISPKYNNDIGPYSSFFFVFLLLGIKVVYSFNNIYCRS